MSSWNTCHRNGGLLLTAILLVGCTLPNQNAPASTVLVPTLLVATERAVPDAPTQANSSPTTVAPATSLPAPAAPTQIPTATVESTAAPTAIPTPIPTLPPPTPAPPTATISPAAALVGLEWSIAALSDLNRDGQLDVVAFKPVAITPKIGVPGFGIVASELVIVQRGLAGPELQLALNRREVIAPGATLARFPETAGPAAFQIQLTANGVGIIPLSAAGDVAAQAATLVWDASVAGYRLSALPGAPAVVAGVPLVGPEWQIALQADLNGNGRRDVVAFKPGPAVTLQAGYTLSASEIVLVEEGLLGNPEIQLALNAQQLSVPGATLVAYPAQVLPTGFMASISATGAIINFSPFDNTGRLLTRGAQIGWSPADGGYRATGTSELLPPPRALVGPEWTIAAKGDLNGDTIPDLVAYKPAGIQVRQPNPAYQIVASEIVIVQQNGAGPYGDPEVQLAINPREIVAPGVPLFSYTASEPSRAVGAFLLAVGATGTPIKLVPISTAGLPLNDLATAAFWESGVPAYRLRAIMQPTPKPTVVSTPVPSPIAKQLVGQEWSILAQGDFNRDGRRDVVAYKPAKIAPRSIDPSMPLTVGALVIVQEGKGGQPELQLSISTTQVVVPGNRLVSYAVPPSGFQIGFVPGRTGALMFVALNSAGEPIGQPSLIEWNPSSQLFQL